MSLDLQTLLAHTIDVDAWGYHLARFDDNIHIK